MAPHSSTLSNDPGRVPLLVQDVSVGAAFGVAAVGFFGVAGVVSTLAVDFMSAGAVSAIGMGPVAVGVVAVKAASYGLPLGLLYGAGMAGVVSEDEDDRGDAWKLAGAAVAIIGVASFFNYNATGRALVEAAEHNFEPRAQILNLETKQADARMTHVPDGRKIVFPKAAA